MTLDPVPNSACSTDILLPKRSTVTEATPISRKSGSIFPKEFLEKLNQYELLRDRNERMANEQLLFSSIDSNGNPIPSRPPPAYSRSMFSSNENISPNLEDSKGETNLFSLQRGDRLKSNENAKVDKSPFSNDLNRSSVGVEKTPYIINRALSAAESVVWSGASRGSRRVLNIIAQPHATSNAPSHPLRIKRRPPSCSTRRNIVALNEGKPETVSRTMPLRRTQSSTELRNLTFQEWFENRGKQYIEAKRQEILKKQQVEEDAKRLREEKAKKNEEIFAIWFAKKQQEALEVKKKRLQEEKEKRKYEETKKQLKTDAEKAFEAWKLKKEKQRERRHSISCSDREKAAEELRKKLEKSIASHLAYEAWQKQAIQRLHDAKEREALKIQEEERQKAEIEAMRRELARTSYTQWELRKAIRTPTTESVPSNQPLVAKPPWRPTSARVKLSRF